MQKPIILLGASGFIGQAFSRELERRRVPFIPVSRKNLDYTKFGTLLEYIRETKPSFLVNAAGYTGKPNVDSCETARAETLAGNTLLVQVIADACEATGLAWGHVSSGCIYSGAKIAEGGKVRAEKNLMTPQIKDLIERSPEAVRGWTETDTPNFSFRDGPCSFYSGTKALAEEALTSSKSAWYAWRLRIPFDESDNPRNYLRKLQNYPKVYDNFNSLSHLGDFVSAALDLWQKSAPPGIYNMTNPGFVSTREVVALIQKIRKPARDFEFWRDDAEFYSRAAKTPRSNCILDSSKLLSTGVKMRPVEEALEAAISLAS